MLSFEQFQIQFGGFLTRIDVGIDNNAVRCSMHYNTQDVLFTDFTLFNERLNQYSCNLHENESGSIITLDGDLNLPDALLNLLLTIDAYQLADFVDFSNYVRSLHTPDVPFAMPEQIPFGMRAPSVDHNHRKPFCASPLPSVDHTHHQPFSNMLPTSIDHNHRKPFIDSSSPLIAPNYHQPASPLPPSIDPYHYTDSLDYIGKELDGNIGTEEPADSNSAFEEISLDSPSVLHSIDPYHYNDPDDFVGNLLEGNLELTEELTDQNNVFEEVNINPTPMNAHTLLEKYRAQFMDTKWDIAGFDFCSFSGHSFHFFSTKIPKHIALIRRVYNSTTASADAFDQQVELIYAHLQHAVNTKSIFGTKPLFREQEVMDLYSEMLKNFGDYINSKPSETSTLEYGSYQ